MKKALFFAVSSLLSLTLVADEFPITPPANFTLNPKYIVLHHPVTTEHIAAQLYFDQGLSLAYAFNHDAAYWSFLKASIVDPTMPMAYWGMAYAMGANINMDLPPERVKYAYDTVQKALQFVDNASDVERSYINALSKRYGNDPNADQKQLAIAYSNAMKEVVQRYPDDLDAATLYAESILNVNPWNQWSVKKEPLEGTMEALNTLESVLKRAPMHLGANHFYVHAIEASPYPERALTSANRLTRLFPYSGHIVHMPSHIYMLVGDYHRAAQSNENAVAVDQQYIWEYGDRGIYPIHYMSHNLYMLSRAYIMEGRYAPALLAAERLERLYTPHFHRMPELEHYALAPMVVYLRFHKWNEMLQFKEPNPAMKTNHLLWHLGRAMAFAGLKDIERAEKEYRLFLEEKKSIPPDLKYGLNDVAKMVGIAENILAGKIAEAKGEYDQSIEFLQKAVSIQDTMHYNEPPDWFYPVRESLGGQLLRSNRYVEAEKVFRADLNHHPRNGYSLFGLKESLSAQGKLYDTFWVDKEFDKAWKYSDFNLSIQDL